MRALLVVAALGVLGAAASACSPDKVIEGANTGSTSKPPPPPPPVAAVDAGAAPIPRMEFSENDFTESDRNRDPFRTYAAILKPEVKKVAKVQKEIVLEQYSLDELKLVAIVTGGDYPRAMVVDPGGKGWVIKRGDWVGRPEVVHIGGANGADYQINWRVSKVRDGDIVFTREDPAQPGIPPASRVIALRPDSEAMRDKL